MSRYNLECIVLKSLNYKDTDKIYTLFSKSKGKITAKANGIRKISSKRAGNMDTLNHVSIAINESASGFKTISEVKGLNSFRNLKKSLEKSAKGYYLSELIHKFSEEGHENSDLYILLLSSLENLNSSQDSYAVVVRFEVLLMKYLGYEMYLDKCAYCRRPFSQDWSDIKFNYALG
ncbi:MAG TPA: DNA repair protein RecO, partial [Candidatus Saccharimonadales bacterium]|nr:DNA repair protein RecO [Candidatus Saccharimonadales bacterium]